MCTDTVNPKEVQDIESTVLYHIYQAAQLNHQHIRDYVRYFKSVLHAPESILEPFMLSVLLTIASIDENQVKIKIGMINVNSFSYTSTFLIYTR